MRKRSRYGLIVSASVLVSVMGITRGHAGLTIRAEGGQNVGGLTFELKQVPLPVPRQEYRYSLCLGRPIPPGTPAPPCLPTTTLTVKNAAAASIVFQTAPATFLPRGLKLDANGVLSGKTDVDLSQAVIRVCARQLNAESCGPIGFGKTPPPQQVANVKKDGKVDPTIGTGVAGANGAGPAGTGGAGPAATGGGGTGGGGLGTAAKVVAGVTAGVAAGLAGWYFAESLAPIDDVPLVGSPSTSSPTSTPTPTPSTTGQCTSTRQCILNLSGGCGSCAGTVNGPCNYFGTQPLGTEGSSCNQGVPCARGFSCNNGRCRSGSNNVCPVQ